MSGSKIAVVVSLALILGVPFAVRMQRGAKSGEDETARLGAADTIIAVTPHVEQIRSEFSESFDRWNLRHYGRHARIDWRSVGGTSEIMKLLTAVYQKETREIVEGMLAARAEEVLANDLRVDGRVGKGEMTFDIFIGGGSYEFGRLKNPETAAVYFAPFPGRSGAKVTVVKVVSPRDRAGLAGARVVDAVVRVEGRETDLRVPVGAIEGGAEGLAAVYDGTGVEVTVDLGAVTKRATVCLAAPCGFSKEQVEAWYGKNEIGTQLLYDPEQYWLGTALSGFGIVFNRDVLRDKGLSEPRSFVDLTDARYAGLLALADPRLSGSVTTTYESILNKEGWEKGWRVLRDLGANARYFASSSTRPPVDVAAGDAAAGLAIDFYGRGQAQAVMKAGETAETCRVGYVDPQGAVYIDADPVAVMLGGPNPELARHFVEFCLSEEAQALWQMPAKSDTRSAGNPVGEGGEKMGPRQYELRRMPVRRVMYEKYGEHFIDRANPFEAASEVKPRGWRDAIAPMMGAFAIDTGEEVKAAWGALSEARAAARTDPAMGAVVAEMEGLFYAMPEHVMMGKDGEDVRVAFSEANYKAIADDTNRWRDPVKGVKARIVYTQFFREQYRRVVEVWREAKRGRGKA